MVSRHDDGQERSRLISPSRQLPSSSAVRLDCSLTIPLLSDERPADAGCPWAPPRHLRIYLHPRTMRLRPGCRQESALDLLRTDTTASCGGDSHICSSCQCDINFPSSVADMAASTISRVPGCHGSVMPPIRHPSIMHDQGSAHFPPSAGSGRSSLAVSLVLH